MEEDLMELLDKIGLDEDREQFDALLEELGMVRKVTNVNNVERYDACCNDHAHFVCTCCKKVIDITGEKEMMVNKFKELNDAYSVSRVCLTLEGVCPDCK